MKNKSEKISRHCGRGPAIQGFYKGKTALLNRLDPGSMSGMTTKRAFTLIELLVVVLIIGILAAVAVPQYQAAVAKARLVQLITLTNAAVNAMEEYYLANGEYTRKWSNLTIDIPGTVNGNQLTSPTGYTLSLITQTSSQPDAVVATDSRIPGVKLYYGHLHTTYQSWAGARYCYALKSNELAQKLCKSVTGKKNKDGVSDTGENMSYIYKF